ncbi:hypothetical protein BG003_003908 [Podila horticola]|nr:hypothetical protein BG003_003908 [Podila horticola]
MSEYSAYRHNSKNSRPGHRPHKDEEAGFTTVYDLDVATPHSDSLSSSSTTEFSSHHTSGHDEDKWKNIRLKFMRMATVKRLQLLWGLLALFGTMAWISLMPAYAFRNKVEPEFKSPAYAFFVVATVGTSLSAVWQSLCPFLIRQSQRALLPRIINHPATQTATILISVILTILNFFSWIILASNKDGAKTNCETGPFSSEAGYVAQCRGVNVAIVLGVIVFFLWIPISVVIVCGTIERGLWWWGEDDGAHAEAIVKGSNMMSEEEFDLKISGQGKSIKRRQTVHPENLRDQQQMIQQPKPAFVTPIASQFRSTTGDVVENNEDEEYFTPSSYRRHQRQRKQQQQQQQQQALQPGEPRRGLTHRASNSSLSSRLSTFFGAGWGTGQMPPEGAEQPPMPQIPSQYLQESTSVPTTPTKAKATTTTTTTTATTARSSPTATGMETNKAESKQEAELEDVSASLHGDGYASQWHSRRYDDWS